MAKINSSESIEYSFRTPKQDALELAQIIYDIYKENLASGNIENGQNYANRTQDL